MFDFLKKKITGITDKIRRKAEKKAGEEQAPEETPAEETPGEEKGKEEQEPGEQKQAKQGIEPGQVLPEEMQRPEEPQTARKETERKPKEPGASEAKETHPQPKPAHEEPGEEAAERKQETPEKQTLESKGKQEPPVIEQISPQEKIAKMRVDDKRELKARQSIRTGIKSVFSREITIEERDAGQFLDELELSLLESDVEQDAAKQITTAIRKSLVGKKISKREELTEHLKQTIRKALEDTMAVPEPKPFWRTIEQAKPCKIMFLGPNGAGKTTTIAKITRMLQKKGKKVVLASSDTVAIYKTYRAKERVLGLLAERGLTGNTVFAADVGRPGQRLVKNLADIAGEDLDYFSLLIVENTGT